MGLFQLRHWPSPLHEIREIYKKSTFYIYICINSPLSSSLISLMYSSLNKSLHHIKHRYVQAWEQQLESCEPSDWAKMRLTISECLININSLEFAYKVFIRRYLVPRRRTYYMPGYPSFCFRGCTNLGRVVYLVDLS